MKITYNTNNIIETINDKQAYVLFIFTKKYQSVLHGIYYWCDNVIYVQDYYGSIYITENGGEIYNISNTFKGISYDCNYIKNYDDILNKNNMNSILNNAILDKILNKI